ncbi:hypothetical protein T439DRAFT_243686 [Meredithblackwellia eburnea MCA 4105]
MHTPSFLVALLFTTSALAKCSGRRASGANNRLRRPVVQGGSSQGGGGYEGYFTPSTTVVAETATAGGSTNNAGSTNGVKTVVSSSTRSQAAANSQSSSGSSGSSSSGTSTSSGGRSTKKGLGFNDRSALTNFGSSISWAYNWASAEDFSMPSGVAYVPMLWGKDTAAWSTNVTKSINAGATTILGFNEPDQSDQSSIDVATAVSLWKANIQQYAGKVKLVSPAITNGAAPMGITWLTSFISQCSGCTIDAVAAHWYDSATNVADFKSHFTDIHTQTGKKIWVTEFMGSGTTAQQQTFLTEVIPWLEAQDFIERYAAFGAANDPLRSLGVFLADTSGTLSALGQTYRDTV